MRVLFIYPYLASYIHAPFDYGIASLAATLKEDGHITRLLSLTGCDLSLLERTFQEFNPELVGISVWSGKVREAVEVVEWIGEFKIPTLVGGIYPTVVPERAILEFKNASGICVGEGDLAMRTFARLCEQGKDFSQIDNLWVWQQSQTIRNPISPLIPDLDCLPFPNREIFDLQKSIDATGIVKFNATRGCPYSCSFCVEPSLRRLYPKGRSLRRRSVRNLISEIQSVLQSYSGITDLGFDDDCFTLGKQWLHEFCQTYASQVGLPYYVNTRVDLMNDEVASLLSDSNCREVRMGIECGNEVLRNQILQKNISDEQIVQAFSSVKRHGISSLAYNMIGVPFETEETIQETLALNREIEPDFVRLSIFQPYVGTRLYELCVSKGWIKADQDVDGYYGPYILQQPSISADIVYKYYHLYRELFKTKTHLEFVPRDQI